MSLFSAIIIALVIVTLGYILRTKMGNAETNRITLHLDEIYTNTNEMACAVYDELIRQGRKCEILDMGKGFPKFAVDGKEYIMTSGMTSISGVPMQVVRLRLYKE